MLRRNGARTGYTTCGSVAAAGSSRFSGASGDPPIPDAVPRQPGWSSVQTSDTRWATGETLSMSSAVMSQLGFR